MYDKYNGLRFDIYERIHLSADLPGITELEEVELVPDIQVIEREDRAELYGQLLLTGLYRGEDDRTQRLVHAIPVEITVPLTRVSSLEDIGVEIENFDIDLLNIRTLNVTGVLSLRGIGGAEAQPSWQQEEYTVAYSPDEGGWRPDEGRDAKDFSSEVQYENHLWTYGEDAQTVNAAETEGASEEAEALVPPEEEAPLQKSAAFADEPQKDKEAKARTHSLDNEVHLTAAFSGPSASWTIPAEAQNAESRVEEPPAGTDAANAAQEPAEVEANEELLSAEEETVAPEPAYENEAVSPEATAPEEKQDLKVAFGSKSGERESLSFSSLLGANRYRKEPEPPAAEPVPSGTAAFDADSEGDWKSRFYGNLSGERMFRKVRLCIVQREDTLDTIAEKYQLSARELVLYNRLSGQTVEEGQVLYIP